MKSTIYLIVVIFCFFMVPISIIGGFIITIATPEMYKASATININMKEGPEQTTKKLKISDILKKDYIFKKASSEKKFQEYCNNEINVFDKPMGQAKIYRLIQNNIAISMPNGGSGHVEIICRTKNPNIAARFANQIAETCIKYINYETKVTTNIIAELVNLAQKPNKPFSPNPKINMAISILISGVFLVIGIISIKVGSNKSAVK